MSTITTINSTDVLEPTSRQNINTNFSNLNTGKVETTTTVNGHALSSNVTVSKSDVSLGNVPNLDTSTTSNITDSTNKRFVTDAQLTVIGNTSGTNTGDQVAGTGLTGVSTLSIDSTVVTLTGSQTLTNKTLTSPIISTISNTGTITLPTSTDTLTGRATTDTLTNKRITKRFITTTQSATPTINTDNTDISSITGLAQAITSMTTNLSGTPNAGDLLMIQITDNGTARAITWGAKFASTTVTLPTTTVISTLLRVLFQWDTVAAVWQCIASA